jgi:hypothetical protein
MEHLVKVTIVYEECRHERTLIYPANRPSHPVRLGLGGSDGGSGIFVIFGLRQWS